MENSVIRDFLYTECYGLTLHIVEESPGNFLCNFAPGSSPVRGTSEEDILIKIWLYQENEIEENLHSFDWWDRHVYFRRAYREAKAISNRWKKFAKSYISKKIPT
jgi:hypothetical protein